MSKISVVFLFCLIDWPWPKTHDTHVDTSFELDLLLGSILNEVVISGRLTGLLGEDGLFT